MINEIERAAAMVQQYRELATLLALADTLQPSSTLILAALHEWRHEVVPERELEGTSHFQDRKLADEMADTLVFTASKGIAHGPGSPDYTVVFAANGEGKRSNIHETVEAVLGDMLDDHGPAAFERFLMLFYSAFRYAPLRLTFLEYFQLTMRKVFNNRHPDLYTTYCLILRRELTDDESLQKLAHLEKATRLLRKRLGRDLRVSDWQREHNPIVFWCLQRWMDSTAALHELEVWLDSQVDKPAASIPSTTVIARPTTQEIILFSNTAV